MVSNQNQKIGVIGAGAWGTALSNILAKNHNIVLWAKEKKVCENINKHNENKRFLPKIKLSKKIKSNISNNFMPERPKNLKIKKRAYRLSRWRRRKLSRV